MAALQISDVFEGVAESLLQQFLLVAVHEIEHAEQKSFPFLHQNNVPEFLQNLVIGGQCGGEEGYKKIGEQGVRGDLLLLPVCPNLWEELPDQVINLVVQELQSNTELVAEEVNQEALNQMFKEHFGFFFALQNVFNERPHIVEPLVVVHFLVFFKEVQQRALEGALELLPPVLMGAEDVEADLFSHLREVGVSLEVSVRLRLLEQGVLPPKVLPFLLREFYLQKQVF